MSDPRHFLINLNYEPGEEFLRALLSTAEFSKDVLGRLGFRRSSKNGRVDDVVNRLRTDANFASEVVLRMCQSPRMWLYFGLVPSGTALDTSKNQSPGHEFLTTFGSRKQWYGPFTDNDYPGHHWYVRTAAVTHYVEESSFSGDVNAKMTPFGVRWHVVAMVGSGYVSLHWNNFSHIEKQNESGAYSGEQFQYWKHIPVIRDELLALLGVPDLKLEEPSFYNLVLNKMFETYEPNPAFLWKHLRVRAEQYGVSMNARSSSAKASKHELDGVRKLTHAFAKSAASAIQLEDESRVSAMERALLRTFIREWGTVSYEFELNRQPVSIGEEAIHLFRGHVYFGERAADAGPDSLAHCRCLQKWGGSNGALRFILEHL